MSSLSRDAFAEGALTRLTVALGADALDELGERRRVLSPSIRPIAPGQQLVGCARTVEVRKTDLMPEHPYEGEMAAIAGLGEGDVPVYQVEAGVKAALFGELFSLAAASRGAVGAVLDGPVRDVRQLVELGYPVFANGICPYDTRGRAEVVERDGPIVCGGVPVESGDLVVADDDGVVIVPQRLVGEVLELVLAKVSSEGGARADIVAGMKVHDVWAKWQAL